MPLYYEDGTHLFTADGAPVVLGEAAGRGRLFVRGTATLDWLPVCLVVPAERYGRDMAGKPNQGPGPTSIQNRYLAVL